MNCPKTPTANGIIIRSTNINPNRDGSLSIAFWQKPKTTQTIPPKTNETSARASPIAISLA
jgi:hypothetical protein